MTTTLGASSGALTSKTVGALASRASSVVIGGYHGPLMGSSVRSTPASWAKATAVPSPATASPAINRMKSVFVFILFLLLIINR